jgi:autotransporter passenger strand-loop-strand repeat protein
MLCVASTSVATLYHYGFGREAPYPWWDLPVVLGTLGGIGLVVGPIGLVLARRRRDPALQDPSARGMEMAFIAMLFLSGLTGLALLVGNFVLNGPAIGLEKALSGTLIVQAGGTLEVASGATLDGFTVSSGVTLKVDTGGAATNTTLLPGGIETVVIGGHGDQVCYVRGTSILTEAGEVAVEDLRAGDRIVTMFGGVRPLLWVGRQSFNGRFLGSTRAPVRFRAGSIAENVPSRDLLVSPAHCMVIDGHLVGACLLVNGATITQEPTAEVVEYYHLDFGVHECVLADGAWSEAYAEHLNRGQFHNVAAYLADHPDHQPQIAALCLPQLQFGDPALADIRAGLLARVVPASFSFDADVHLVLNGQRIEPRPWPGEGWQFHVPTGARNVVLCSRASVPANIGLGPDERRLGLCVQSLRRPDGPDMTPDEAGLHEGLHTPEPGTSARWTEGMCPLPDALFAGTTDGDTLCLTIKARTLARYAMPAKSDWCDASAAPDLLNEKRGRLRASVG